MFINMLLMSASVPIKKKKHNTQIFSVIQQVVFMGSKNKAIKIEDNIFKLFIQSQ